MRSPVVSIASLFSVASFASLACVVVLSGVACSSSETSEPAAFENDPVAIERAARAAEEAELRELEIDPASEPIANESDDTSFDTDESVQLDEFGEPILNVAPETLLDNPLYDDEEDAPEITTLSVSPLITPGQLPDAEKVAKIVRGPWKCRLNGNTPADCVCKGSPLNCQIPNRQTGRNRYLPPSFATEMEKRVAAERARTGQKVASPVDAGKWHIAENTIVYDGAGKLRGRLAKPGELPPPPAGEFKPVNTCKDWAAPEGVGLRDASGLCAKINFGGKKRLKPEGGAEATFVYAFNVLVAVSSPSGLDASGWVPLTAVQGGDLPILQSMPTVAGRRITRDASFAGTHYVVKSAKDWGGSPAGFKAKAVLPAYAESKVAPGHDANRKVGDYLLKDGNVWNLAYNTPGIGGIGTDTFIVEHGTTGFRRVKSTAARPTLVRVRVYGNPRKTSMVFAYGSVAGRFGWVALDAIKRGTVSAPSGAGYEGYCTGKADGTYCNENASILGYVCKGGEVLAGLRCASPNTICDGPSPDGQSLVCHF